MSNIFHNNLMNVRTGWIKIKIIYIYEWWDDRNNVFSQGAGMISPISRAVDSRSGETFAYPYVQSQGRGADFVG